MKPLYLSELHSTELYRDEYSIPQSDIASRFMSKYGESYLLKDGSALVCADTYDISYTVEVPKKECLISKKSLETGNAEFVIESKQGSQSTTLLIRDDGTGKEVISDKGSITMEKDLNSDEIKKELTTYGISINHIQASLTKEFSIAEYVKDFFNKVLNMDEVKPNNLPKEQFEKKYENNKNNSNIIGM